MGERELFHDRLSSESPGRQVSENSYRVAALSRMGSFVDRRVLSPPSGSTTLLKTNLWPLSTNSVLESSLILAIEKTY